MINSDIPEYKQPPPYVFYIDVQDELKRIEELNKKWEQIAKEIEEKHNEKIPNPFSDNILRERVLTDSTSSLSFSVSSSKGNLETNLKNEINKIDFNYQYNVIVNFDPDIKDYYFDEFDFNQLNYSPVLTNENGRVKFSCGYAPIKKKFLK